MTFLWYNKQHKGALALSHQPRAWPQPSSIRRRQWRLYNSPSGLTNDALNATHGNPLSISGNTQATQTGCKSIVESAERPIIARVPKSPKHGLRHGVKHTKKQSAKLAGNICDGNSRENASGRSRKRNAPAPAYRAEIAGRLCAPSRFTRFTVQQMRLFMSVALQMFAIGGGITVDCCGWVNTTTSTCNMHGSNTASLFSNSSF